MTTSLIQQTRPEAIGDRVADGHTTPQPRPRRELTVRISRGQVDAAADRWLGRYSLLLLRISMGVTILAFGVLKYFPGVSPAQDLVLATTHVLAFGLVPGSVALVALATVECLIGLSLITGWGLRMSIYLTALWILGILSPLVVPSGRLFSGPDHAPTLEGQYVLKDLVLLAATLVIATTVRHTAVRVGAARQTELTAREPEVGGGAPTARG